MPLLSSLFMSWPYSPPGSVTVLNTQSIRIIFLRSLHLRLSFSFYPYWIKIFLSYYLHGETFLTDRYLACLGYDNYMVFFFNFVFSHVTWGWQCPFVLLLHISPSWASSIFHSFSLRTSFTISFQLGLRLLHLLFPVISKSLCCFLYNLHLFDLRAGTP